MFVAGIMCCHVGSDPDSSVYFWSSRVLYHQEIGHKLTLVVWLHTPGGTTIPNRGLRYLITNSCCMCRLPPKVQRGKSIKHESVIPATGAYDDRKTKYESIYHDINCFQNYHC